MTGRHRAGLFANGFQRRRGVYFNRTNSPVGHMSSIHLLLAHAHTRRALVLQVSIKNDFPIGYFDKEVYFRQVEGFVENRHPHLVSKLNKTLYGLKQVSRGFYSALCRALRSYRHTPLQLDPVVSFGRDHGRDTWVVAYVDSLLIIGYDKRLLEKVVSLLRQRFTFFEPREPSESVGIVLVFDKKSNSQPQPMGCDTRDVEKSQHVQV